MQFFNDKIDKSIHEMDDKFREDYEKIFHSLPFVLITFDNKGCLIKANKYAEELTGKKFDSFKGKHFNKFSVLGKKDTVIAIKEFAKNLMGTVTSPTIYTILRPDGGKRLVEMIGIPIKENGRVVRVVDVGRDITERVKAKELLEESEKKSSFLINNIDELVFIISKAGKILFANNKFISNYGYSKDEIINHSITEFLSKKSALFALKALADEFMGKSHVDIKLELQTKKGEIRIISIADGSEFVKEKGENIGILINARDITEQQELESRHEEEKERFKVIYENAPDAIYLNDYKGNFIDGNKKAEELTGYKRDELIGKNFLKLNLLKKPGLLRAARLLALNIQGKKTGPEEFKITRKNGSEVLVEVDSYPVHIAGKNLIMGVARDVIDRKRAEEAMKKERDKLRTYLDLVKVIIVSLDINRKVKLINKTGCELLGYEENEIIGKNWFDNFIPENKRESVISVFNKIINGEVKTVEYFENEILTNTGEQKIISWHNTVLKNNKGEIVGTLGSGEDITERKNMSKKITSSEQEWSRTFDSMADGISIISSDFRIINVNEFLCKLLKKTSEELIGKKCHNIFHDNECAVFNSMIMTTLKTKKEKKVELYEKKFNKWLSIHTSPVLDKTGKVEKIIHVVRDISERKKADEEYRLRNIELEKSNKLMVGRELKMMELKKKIRELEKRDVKKN